MQTYAWVKTKRHLWAIPELGYAVEELLNMNFTSPNSMWMAMRDGSALQDTANPWTTLDAARKACEEHAKNRLGPTCVFSVRAETTPGIHTHQLKEWTNFAACCRTLGLVAFPIQPSSIPLPGGKWYGMDMAYIMAKGLSPRDIYHKALIIFDPATGQFEFNIPTNLIVQARLHYMELCSIMMTFAYEKPNGQTSAKAKAESEAQAQA